jgi:hypothetical protein
MHFVVVDMVDMVDMPSTTCTHSVRYGNVSNDYITRSVIFLRRIP